MDSAVGELMGWGFFGGERDGCVWKGVGRGGVKDRRVLGWSGKGAGAEAAALGGDAGEGFPLGERADGKV